MTTQTTTAQDPLEDSLKPADSQEQPANGEETPIENEVPAADSEEQPAAEIEEEAPKTPEDHAKEKIRQLGTKASILEKQMTSAVIKKPEMLIELYDPKSELFNRDLADKIREAYPEVYREANEAYLNKGKPAGAPPAQDVERLIAAGIEKYQKDQESKQALESFKKDLNLSDEDYAAVVPQIKTIATQLLTNGHSPDYRDALERAYIALFPGEYENVIKKDAYLNASKKIAATNPGGGSSPSLGKSNPKLSAEDEIAIKTSGQTPARYLELKEKYGF